MSQLSQFLDAYAPPSVPAGLAQRAAAAAAGVAQERGRIGRWSRGVRRGGWRRGMLIGGAAVGLVFTSAVAAEVASGGRIEIPVVHQVVEAVPILKATAHAKEKPVQLASLERKSAPEKPAVAPAPEAGPPPVAATPRERLVEKFAEAKKQVAERRAAGLPTPNADRIERKAKRIVERREAAGLPASSLDEVEVRVAVREWMAMRMLRRVANNPTAITNAQVQRFARILPQRKREQFLALGRERQRLLMGQAAQRFLARRMRPAGAEATTPPPAQPQSSEIDRPTEGLAEEQR